MSALVKGVRVRYFSAQPLGEAHFLQPLLRGRAIVAIVAEQRVVFAAGRLQQRLLDVDLDLDIGHLIRKDPAIAEELAEPDRHVRAREECFQRLFRNSRQRLVGGPADLLIRILEQQHQNRELLVRARRERAERRLHADVALDFAALEKIEKGCWTDHRFWR